MLEAKQNNDYCTGCKVKRGTSAPCADTDGRVTCVLAAGARPLEENEEVWEVFLASFGQWRTSFGGIIGIDLTPVFRVADVLGIELDALDLGKLTFLSDKYVEMTDDK